MNSKILQSLCPLGTARPSLGKLLLDLQPSMPHAFRLRGAHWPGVRISTVHQLFQALCYILGPAFLGLQLALQSSHFRFSFFPLLRSQGQLPQELLDEILVVLHLLLNFGYRLCFMLSSLA